MAGGDGVSGRGTRRWETLSVDVLGKRSDSSNLLTLQLSRRNHQTSCELASAHHPSLCMAPCPAMPGKSTLTWQLGIDGLGMT